MTNDPGESSDAGCASTHQSDGVLKNTLRKRIALIALEIVLVVVIIGLLVATWLPAIIGANPDAPRNLP